MRSEIRKLARLEDGTHPVCSLYLNVRWDDEQQRERIRLFTKNQLKKGLDQLRDRDVWRKAFLQDQQQIERYVDGLVKRRYDEDVNGVAIFSSSGAQIFLTYPSFIPFENEFHLGSRPALKPLVRHSSQYQNTLAVMVDTDSAKLFEISLEGVPEEWSIENYVPGRHDQGGWAQMRYQRHIKDHMDRHHKEVAEHLAALYDTGKWKRVVLMGQERIVANFRAFLPERVKQQIVDTLPMDFFEERPKVVRKLLERLLQKEREEASDQIRNLKERGLKAGTATLGLNGTIEAINKGQVHTLYLLAEFALSGAKCLRCGSLSLPPSGKSSAATCSVCTGEAKIVELGEEMTKTVLRQDGDVKWVEENPVLKDQDGVGASLRFRLSR